MSWEDRIKTVGEEEQSQQNVSQSSWEQRIQNIQGDEPAAVEQPVARPVEFSVLTGEGNVMPTVQERVNQAMAETPQAEIQTPEMKRILAGLAAEIAISEGAKAGGTAVGASIGGAASVPTAGVTSPITVPVGATTGYIAGALSGGFTGSLAAQKIEGQKEISYGRAVGSALTNLIPGGIGKFANKGPVWVQRIARQVAKRPVVSTAAIGAAAAPTAITVERLVDKGELPTESELAFTALTGGVLGGALGKTSQYGSKLLMKYAGRPPEVIDAMVRRGNPDAVNYIDAVSKGVQPNELATAADVRQYIGELGQIAKARTVPSFVAGKEATEAMRRGQNIVQAQEQAGRILNKRVESFINKSENPDLAEQFVNDYLLGRQVGPVPMEIQGIADDLNKARTDIFELQRQLLDNHYSGQRVLTDDMRQTIEDSLNQGDYLTQEYRFFLDKDYNPTPKQAKEAIDSLVRDGMSNKDAEEYIAGLNAARQGNMDLQKIQQAVSSGILKEKKNLSPELESYLGIITRPGDRIEGTMSKLARLATYDATDFQVKNILHGLGIAKIGGEGIAEGNYVPLNLRRGLASVARPGTPNAVDQLYVPKPVQVAINSLYGMDIDGASGSSVLNIIKDLFGAGTALSKASRVILGLPAYFTNIYGGAASLLSQGINPFKRYTASNLKQAVMPFEAVAIRVSPETLKRFDRLNKAGLINADVAASDIRAGLARGVVGRTVQRGLNLFGKMYSIPDTMARLAVQDANTNFLSKVVVGSADDKQLSDKLFDFGARMTNATYQNYDYLSKTTRDLSKYGALSQFVAYWLEFARNQYNQVKIIRQMLNGQFADELEKIAAGSGRAVDREAIRNEGYKRLAAMTATYGATAAGVAAWNKYKSGFTPEQEDAIRNTVLNDYDKHKQLVFKKGEGDKIYWTVTSYINPQSQFIGPVVAALNEDGNTWDKVKTGLLATWEEVGGEGSFVINSAVNALQNYDPKARRRITDATDPVGNAADRLEWFASDAFMPNFANEYKRAVDPYRKQPWYQTAMRQVGIRVNDATITDQAINKLKARKDALLNLSANYAFSQKRKPAEVAAQDYEKLNKDYQDNSSAIIRHVADLRTLGKNEDEIMKILRESDLGPEKVLNAVDGVVSSLPKVKPETTSDKYAKLQGKTPREKEKEIMEIGKTDPFLARDLASMHKRALRADALKISERDRAIMTLDDAARAKYIWDRMQMSQDPQGVFNQYLKKGVINKETAYTIEQYKKSQK